MSDTETVSNNSFSVFMKRLKGKGVGAVVARGASGSFGVMVLGAAMAFASNLLLARLLGVGQYGIYIYILTWINLLALVCKLGLDTSLLRFVAAYNANEQWSLLRGILTRSMQIVFLFSIVFGISIAIIVWIYKGLLGEEKAVIFWFALLLLPLLGLTGLRHAALQSLKHVVRGSLPDSFFRPLVIILLTGSFYFVFHQQLSALHVMIFNFIGVVVAFVVGSVWLVKAMPEKLRIVKPCYAVKKWIVVAIPSVFVSGMHLLLKQTDILMIGAILGTKQAGVYAVVSRISDLVAFGLQSANTIVAPMISECFSTGRHNELQRVMTLAARGIFIFSLIVSIGLALFGSLILSVFGGEFAIGYIPLIILLGQHLINAFSGSGGYLMVMTGFQKQHAQIVGVIVLINFVANIVLIPIMEMNGAAIATVMSAGIWNIWMLIFVRRKLSINPTILAKLRY